MYTETLTENGKQIYEVTISAKEVIRRVFALMGSGNVTRAHDVTDGSFIVRLHSGSVIVFKEL